MRLHGADGTPTPWLTDRAFHDRLAQPASVFWEDSPLREYLLDFARAQRIAVLLDRRVDPDQKLDLAVRQEPVLAVFRAVAISRNLRVSTLGNVVYLGPPANAEQIRTVAELRRQEIAVLGSAASRKFAKQAPIAWKDLDSPRDLLSGLAEQNGLDIVNLDRVPHDLWAAGSYPSMSLADRLTLILHQFDLTFQVAADARRVAIGPLPQDVALVREYPGGPKPEKHGAPRCRTANSVSPAIASTSEDSSKITKRSTRCEPPAENGRTPAETQEVLAERRSRSSRPTSPTGLSGRCSLNSPNNWGSNFRLTMQAWRMPASHSNS
jgi:hypothetical protein